MADSNALVTIESSVTDFLLGYKKTTDDYVTYLKHACDLLRDFRLFDSKEAVSEKVSIDSLGIIEMPDSMIRFKELSVAVNGEWWTFTEKPNMVNTTTTTLLVEGHDSDFGEGVSVRDGVTNTYGARGGVNAYYFMLDWNARRIFCDGITSDTVLLKYASSGISITGVTYIPTLIVLMLENYLLWKETFWIKELVRERDSRKKDFDNERLRVRNVLNSLTASQWKDLLWGTFSQAPKR